MKGVQLTKLFQSIQHNHKEMLERFEDTGAKFDQLYEVLDSQTEILERLDQENSAINHQLSRQEQSSKLRQS